jgi:Tol biopolymer transport system component
VIQKMTPVGAAVLLVLMVPTPAHAATELRRMSQAPSGEQANGESGRVTISRTGGLVAFDSYASNLVAGDTNGDSDIFLYDVAADELELLTHDRSGGPTNGSSGLPDMSANGRYVAFVSRATDLVKGDDNGVLDVFVLDSKTGTTEIVSARKSGVLGNKDSTSPRISSNGRYVAFDSHSTNLSRLRDRNHRTDVFIHDRVKGTTNRVSVGSHGEEGNDHSFVEGVSSDGRRVAFISFADNLVPNDTNGFGDAFVYDREARKTIRASVSSDEKQSATGGFPTDLSADGRYVLFIAESPLVPDDTNEVDDVFMRDLRTGTTRRISVASDGAQANSYSHNDAQFNADGCLVAFVSHASNLDSGDSNNQNDIFIRDRCSSETTRVNVKADGTQADGGSRAPQISADGSHVAFISEATNLDGPDTNELEDAFLAIR